MLTVCSHHGRTIVGRLERGEDLLDGLRALCASRQIRCGVVSAVGALEQAEVAHYLPSQRAYGPARTLTGPLEILSVTGNLSESDGELSIRLQVTLSREGDNGVEVMGGRLLSGRVYFCELSVLALDDVLLRRAPDPDIGLGLWNQGFEKDADGSGREVEPSTQETDAARKALLQTDSERSIGSPAGVPGERLTDATPKARRGAASRGATSGSRTPAAQEATTTPATPAKAAASAVNGYTDAAKDSAQQVPSALGTQRPPAQVSGTLWAEVAAASAAIQRDPVELPMRPDRETRTGEEDPPDMDEEEENAGDYVDLEAGDIVEHPKFGRCRVERVEGEDEYVHVRLRNRNTVRLSLDVISLELIGSESGHQVFRARIG